ncbi:MBL fold metallo-hydrolase RNA specificity domain-containing protein [Coraliomargarita sp. SDUM461003]|uniref:MBL fold metallo-hydrolase RNA specificity domain-containing protein n=1 Tax=Thalassobacterium maritimum TaxID=3041265 RepID=A0ABU1AWY6_9BACT|nr:MBL fold metallo-hydrolase RNA specificity domain-containing protein [Coraliomargarita sp. SDUM461003]MDQ8208112.1 MBL fold metallo-hydrolase RNA specificity domain-containing protein [Coraliomargarita sp. SDUM461003]
MLKPIYRGGLLLPECQLWFDPRKRKPFAVISHAHGDHVANHDCYLATPETIALIRVRNGNAMADRGRALSYGEVYVGKGYRLSFYPAGHVLGSAMAYLETDAGETFLYTGDFKTRQGLAAEAIDVPQADTLVMETTFGRAEYVFPSFEETCARIHDFCDRALAAGSTPVLLAYSLGKAQEVLKILELRPQALMVHKAIAPLNQVYSAYGVVMPDTRPLDFLNMRDCIVVMPPAVLKKMPRKDCLVAMVSGWGMDGSAKYRYGVDEVLPLSDHADFPDLLQFVDQVAPKTVYATHGYEQAFAATLRGRGYTAWSLAQNDQLELNL